MQNLSTITCCWFNRILFLILIGLQVCFEPTNQSLADEPKTANEVPCAAD